MNDSYSNDHRLSAKKHKKSDKKHKKEKKHKHKKRTRKSSSSENETILLKEKPTTATVVEKPALGVQSVDAFGPALPPHLLLKEIANKDEIVPVIGPALPQGLLLVESQSEENRFSEDDEVYGPTPITADSLKSMTTTQIELEQRALEIKLAKLDPDANKVDANAREEWMLELPEVGLKTGLASLKRTFHTKERPDFSDRSSWTKTPNSSNEPSTSKLTETSKSKAEEQYQAVRDAEQAKIAKKLKKKHKRDESLYDIHQKKLKKDKEKKEKDTNGKPERRPFSRDVDLQMNKIDKNQTKSIVDKAKFLDSRFSSGNAKYL